MKGGFATLRGTSIDKEMDYMDAEGVACVFGSGLAWY